MTNQLKDRIGRRSVLQGLGVAALGLGGAALLGCSSKKGASSGAGGGGSQNTSAASGTSGGGLPLTAPVVQGKQRQGGTYTASAGTTTYRQHDPDTALGPNIFHIVGEKGLEPDPRTGAIRPHVLTSWEVADPSGLTLTFKVNPNLYIHNVAPWNGRQFTAQDVAFNIERIAGLTAEKEKIPVASFQRASMVANLVKAEAVDPLTVKVTLSKPNSSFFNGLMDTRVPFMPKEMVDIGFNDPMKMAGVGPYQVTEWTQDVRTSFKRFDKYFRQGEPHFDTFTQIVIPDTASTQAAFISGQIQVGSAATPDLMSTLSKAKPDANLYAWIDSNWEHFRPSMTYQPFADFRVRKAISLAVDYAGISDGYYGPGWGYQLALNPGYPEAWKPDKVKTLPGFNPDTKAADRTEANRLMTAAGFPGGKGIDFEQNFITSIDSHRENTTRFQSQMQSVFPDMKISLKSFPDLASFSVPQAAGTFKMVTYVITASPDAVIEMTSQYYTNGSRNYGKFTNPDVDKLLDKAAAELNADNRTKLMDDFQQKFLTEWMPNIVLHANPARSFVQGNIGGYDTTAGTWFGYSSTTKVCRWFYVDK